MITKTIHEKGFQLVKLELKDMQRLNSPGLCDKCSKQMQNGIFIGQLNKIYCDTCLPEWEQRAVFYDQDVAAETRITDRLLAVLNTMPVVLSHKNVNDTFVYCLFEKGENIVDPLIAEGVNVKAGFHRERLKEATPTIEAMLIQLPDSFKKSIGGGMSFLNMSMDKNNQQWTSTQAICDQLVMLGAAIGKVEFKTPREQWNILPGGVPYIVVF